MDVYLQAAIDEARTGQEEGGVPIGSVLVHEGRIIGRGPRPCWKNRKSMCK